jgi:GTP cyclohydrolase IA
MNWNLVEEYFLEKYKDWPGKVNFLGTGARLHRLYEELCWPMDRIDEEIQKAFKSVFEDNYSEMLCKGPIDVWTLCPHHLVPCNFETYIGYIPEGNKVLGLSKFSRIAIAMAKRPIMQEQYSSELAEIFEKGLKPTGVGVLVIGSHGCVQCRGVHQNSKVTTTVLKGQFLSEPSVKAEFYRNIDILRSSNGG